MPRGILADPWVFPLFFPCKAVGLLLRLAGSYVIMCKSDSYQIKCPAVFSGACFHFSGTAPDGSVCFYALQLEKSA